MNQINVKRLVLAGFAMFLMWIAVEFLIEGVLGRLLFGDLIEATRIGTPRVTEWSGLNHALNLGVAIVNSTLFIWLYASLRPMYGVGTRAALITSAFGVVWLWSLFLNLGNLGLFPAQAGFVEAIYESIELPIAMLVGAAVYEGPAPEEPSFRPSG